MKRCDRCKGGKVPERTMVTYMSTFTIPMDYLLVHSCPWCENRLSRTSAQKLNHQTVIVYRYEDTA